MTLFCGLLQCSRMRCTTLQPYGCEDNSFTRPWKASMMNYIQRYRMADRLVTSRDEVNGLR